MPVLSILMTVAPSPASNQVALGPESARVRSTTTIPSSGPRAPAASGGVGSDMTRGGWEPARPAERYSHPPGELPRGRRRQRGAPRGQVEIAKHTDLRTV